MLKTTQVVATSETVTVDLSSNGAECVVILSLGDGIYYEIQGIGARFWNMVQSPLPFGEVLDTILHEYDVEAERCKVDLIALIKDLQSRKLLEIR